MKLRYFSDLHLCHKSNADLSQIIKKIIVRPDDICIIAGDLCEIRHPNYSYFLSFIDKNFKKSFIVPGNHEYYGNTVEYGNSRMREIESKHDNINILLNERVSYLGYNFIGSTLWTHIKYAEKEPNETRQILDHNITTRNALHHQSKEFIINALHERNNIIITHHVPSRKLIHKKFMTPKFAPWIDWYYTDMDSIFDKAAWWFYGHTHMPEDKVINGCRFLCNPADDCNKTIIIE